MKGTANRRLVSITFLILLFISLLISPTHAAKIKMKIINFFANKLPDYTYSIPGLLLYFFDPGHTGWGFRFRERFFFHSNDLLVDMKGKVGATRAQDKEPGLTILGLLCMQSCLIAGGNAGIGRAAANGLAKMGATVHIISRNKDKGSSAVQEIKVYTLLRTLLIEIASLMYHTI